MSAGNTDTKDNEGKNLKPRWVRNLLCLLSSRSQFVLTDNIGDRYLLPTEGGYELYGLHDCLWAELSREGFDFIVRYDPVDGVSLYPKGNAQIEEAAKRLGINLAHNGHMQMETLKHLYEIIRNTVIPLPVKGQGQSSVLRVAIVLDFASRIHTSPQDLQPSEHLFFVGCEKLAQTAEPIFVDTGKALFNPVIFLANRADDLPPWFGRANHRTDHLSIALPDRDQRTKAAEILLPGQLSGWEEDGSDQRKNQENAVNIFAGMSDGLTLYGMEQITQMAKSKKLGLADIDDAVRSYKTGNFTLENPWGIDGGLKQHIGDAQTEIRRCVLGQEPAIDKTLDILKRSVMSLTGAQFGPSRDRPRGVLFFAGPTGVGKTELAKKLTQSIFGDPQAYIRFDMSEFSSEHADARLLGAPPGYVGYSGGGELTNAIRRRPFSVILFDEIEKAHPRILDKFLQVIDDGRMTDGQGQTVYFSEAVIVFTSNLGIMKRKRVEDTIIWEQVVKWKKSSGDKTKDNDEKKKVREIIRNGIDDYFKNEISRPELLNRLGDNIVVFDFIDEEVGKDILQKMLNSIIERMKEEHKSELFINETATKQLECICLDDLSNGGRGIGNMLETALINPLAGKLFDDKRYFPGMKITVNDVTLSVDRYKIKTDEFE